MSNENSVLDISFFRFKFTVLPDVFTIHYPHRKEKNAVTKSYKRCVFFKLNLKDQLVAHSDKVPRAQEHKKLTLIFFTRALITTMSNSKLVTWIFLPCIMIFPTN